MEVLEHNKATCLRSAATSFAVCALTLASIPIYSQSLVTLTVLQLRSKQPLPAPGDWPSCCFDLLYTRASDLAEPITPPYFRYAPALTAALAPSATAVTICLSGLYLISPATKTPSLLVTQFSPAIT